MALTQDTSIDQSSLSDVLMEIIKYNKRKLPNTVSFDHESAIV
jgi:hypothetical protein